MWHDSGMRPDEIIRLRWDDILWDKYLIFTLKGKVVEADSLSSAEQARPRSAADSC